MNKNRESILESPSRKPADVSVVALKEIDYIAFECRAFDVCDLGFYETVT